MPTQKASAKKPAEAIAATSAAGGSEPPAPPVSGRSPPAPAPSAPGTSEEDLRLVEQKCAKCHSLSLALSSSLSDANWKLHMKRMASRPGAAITEEQAERIHAVLRTAIRQR
jgi:hypothetical protein